jgi:hypothetical protein
MEAFVKKLHEWLQTELNKIDPETSPVKGYNKKIELVENAITLVKGHLTSHRFANKTVETNYFKHWAPSFFKLQILYSLLYNIEQTRITVSEKDEMIRYLRKCKKRVDRFLKKHKDLRLYYHMEQRDKDEELFISIPPSKSEDFLTADNFYCKNTINLAKIMAYEECLPVLTNELQEAMAKPQTDQVAKEQPIVSGTKYKWNPNKAQTAEIVYSFVKMKCISVDGHDADIKDVAALFKDVFDVDLDNIYDVQLHNKRRKKDKAPYLNALREAYLGPGT